MIKKIVKWKDYDVNSYILDINRKIVIIDCNCNVYNYLLLENITPDYIFLTHEHFDHIEGIGLIKKHFQNVRLIASKESSQCFSDCTRNMSLYFDGHNVAEPEADIELNSNHVFEINGQQIKCYFTPGHTIGSMVISIDKMLFTGDTILNNTKTPKNTPTSSKSQLIDSIEFIDSRFDGDYMFLPGHGKSFLKKNWDINITLGKKH